ncbi:secreted protein PRY1-like [Actinia tenebrosa]|uniref:Secreted protein PRY1-like n=1 Tax=Actinia tenebrosa TaxID=6105 RepID=A0A6P8IMI0_ACTTE|nr:secreted protein PRY1-like [Actinia tenebrosa]
MFSKSLFVLAVIFIVAVFSICDARYIKKHLKHHDRSSKKNRIRHVQVRPGKKQMLGGLQGGCCASAQAGITTEDPNACCQSASPPPCCQQSVQLQPQFQPQFQPQLQSQFQPQFQPQLPPPLPSMPSPGCCSQGGAPTMGQSPFSCCQSPTPPPCCQQSAQFQAVPPPPQPSMPSPGCCSQNGAPMMAGQSPFSCCQSSSPPPCCNQPMAVPQSPPMSMPSTGCCSNAPSPPDANGVYLGIAHPDQQCCQAANPPPCCFGLHLKPGQSKNISMNGGGKNYVLSVHLSNATNVTDNATANPCKIPTCAPPTSIPTSGASSAPTSGPTSASTGSSNATSGPSKPSSAPTSGVSGSTAGSTPSPGSTLAPAPTGGPSGSTECQSKALAEHNAKRTIHNSPPMTLDPQLNSAAQAYAEKLASSKTVEHSPQNERQGQGENLAKRCSKPDTGFDCKAATVMWYDEVKKYDWGSPGYSGLTGHFTQVVWKASTKLGIGKASFVNDAGLTCYVIVGRYKDAGNIKGQFPANVQKGSYVGRRSQLLE